MTQTIVDDAITSRMSTGAFTAEPVPRGVLMDLLRVASRAPSRTNTQPWKVYVLEDASRATLIDKDCAAHYAIRAEPTLVADFDAPVGMMFTIDRVTRRGSLVDFGMFLQNIMFAARGRGLHTCPQAARNGSPKSFCRILALGYADETDVVNTFHTPREPVEDFTHWLD